MFKHAPTDFSFVKKIMKLYFTAQSVCDELYHMIRIKKAFFGARLTICSGVNYKVAIREQNTVTDILQINSYKMSIQKQMAMKTFIYMCVQQDSMQLTGQSISTVFYTPKMTS